MSKFKVGDDVFIKAKIVKLPPCGDSGYLVVSSGDLMSHWESEVYSILEKTYEDGLNDAWELAYKIVGLQKNGAMSIQDTLEIFGTEYAGDRDEILHDFTVRKAIEKIKTWEDAKEIRVGDIVLSDDSLTGVVSSIRTKSAYVLWADGSVGYRDIDVLKKTGRQIDVKSLLKQIGGVE